jgi:ubiquinone biosynthesis protein COQ4
MDLAGFQQFAERLAPADERREGLGGIAPVDPSQLSALLAEQERRLNLPMAHPDRPLLRRDWIRAWKHFRVLGKNIDLTFMAFRIFDALPWTTVGQAAAKFIATPQGQAIYASEPFLPDLLDDHDALLRLPRGSLGRIYCEQMQRDGMKAVGLVAEFEKARGDKPRLDDKVEWYLDRLRDTHDLLHTASGFDRDVLGEQCVLAFVFKQRPSMGHLFVGYAGAVLTRLDTPWKVPVLRAVIEARIIGMRCLPIAEQPIRELLPLPLAEARARLGIREARYYPEALRIMRDAGVDPGQVLVKAAA